MADIRFMGLDVGDKTIGVAISDPLMITAQGKTTIIRESLKVDIDRIIDYILEENIEIIVIGLPYNMNGTLGPQGEKTLSFKKNLEKKIKYSERIAGRNVTIDMWDERLTSAFAERALIEGNVRRENRKSVIDKIAAGIILQSYLDKYNLQKSKISED